MNDTGALAVDLFLYGNFRLHAGYDTDFKIDCDALTDNDIAVCARLLASIVGPFGSVRGVPRGGDRLAKAMRAFVIRGPVLIVDDVFTSGSSLQQHRQGDFRAKCAVLFARRPPPDWVTVLFTLNPAADPA